jgi:hypothetical protein
MPPSAHVPIRLSLLTPRHPRRFPPPWRQRKVPTEWTKTNSRASRHPGPGGPSLFSCEGRARPGPGRAPSRARTVLPVARLGCHPVPVRSSVTDGDDAGWFSRRVRWRREVEHSCSAGPSFSGFITSSSILRRPDVGPPCDRGGRCGLPEERNPACGAERPIHLAIAPPVPAGIGLLPAEPGWHVGAPAGRAFRRRRRRLRRQAA